MQKNNPVYHLLVFDYLVFCLSVNNANLRIPPPPYAVIWVDGQLSDMPTR